MRANTGMPPSSLKADPNCYARMAPRIPQLLPLPTVGRSYRLLEYPYTVRVHSVSRGTVWCFLEDGRPNPQPFPLALTSFYRIT